MNGRCGLGLATLLWSTPAVSDEHPMVALELHACLGDSRADIRRVAQVELGDLMTDGAEAPGERTHASVTCDGPVAILRIDDPRTHRSIWRRIDLGTTTAQPRLIALALVELISASWTELEAALPSHVVDSPLAPSGSVHAHVSRGSLPGYRAILTGGVLKFSADANTLAGFGVRVTDASPSRVGWMVDAQAHRGSTSMTLGQISTDVVAVGAAAQLHLVAGSTRVDLGAGLRGGAVRMMGVPSSMSVHGRSFWAPWYGPLVRGNVAVPISDRVAIDAAAEVGFVLSPVNALVDGRREAAVDGTWLQLHLGIVVGL